MWSAGRQAFSQCALRLVLNAYQEMTGKQAHQALIGLAQGPMIFAWRRRHISMAPMSSPWNESCYGSDARISLDDRSGSSHHLGKEDGNGRSSLAPNVASRWICIHSACSRFALLPLTTMPARAQQDQAEAKATLRVVHASPGAPEVDVLVDGQPILERLAYGSASEYLPITAESHRIQIVPTGKPPTLPSWTKQSTLRPDRPTSRPSSGYSTISGGTSMTST